MLVACGGSLSRTLVEYCDYTSVIEIESRRYAVQDKDYIDTSVEITEQVADAYSQNTERPMESWREAYSVLLQEYNALSDQVFFLLYDFDKNGTPELIVVGEHDDSWIDVVYTFRYGSVFQLDYDDNVYIAGFALSLRFGVVAPHDNSPGLITYSIGPSAGAFGTSAQFSRIVIDNDKLVIDIHGIRYVDLYMLHGLFDDFGINHIGDNELNNALKEHTHWYINNIAISSEEFYQMFTTDGRLAPLRITEANIADALFTHKNYP